MSLRVGKVLAFLCVLVAISAVLLSDVLDVDDLDLDIDAGELQVMEESALYESNMLHNGYQRVFGIPNHRPAPTEVLSLNAGEEDLTTHLQFGVFESNDPIILVLESIMKMGGLRLKLKNGVSDTKRQKLAALMFAYSLKQGLLVPNNIPEVAKAGWKGATACELLPREGAEVSLECDDRKDLYDLLLGTPPPESLTLHVVEMLSSFGDATSVVFDDIGGLEYNALEPLEKLRGTDGANLQVTLNWYRFCQQERTSKYFSQEPILRRMAEELSKESKLTKDFMKVPKDLVIPYEIFAHSNDIILNNALLELPLADIYFRFILQAASQGGKRNVQVVMNDAHEPAPLQRAAQEMSTVYSKRLEVKLVSSLKKYLRSIIEGLAGQKLLIVAPDFGQAKRLDRILEALSVQIGKGGNVDMFYLTASRDAASKVQECCFVGDASSPMQWPDLGNMAHSSATRAPREVLPNIEKLEDASICPSLVLIVDDFTNTGGTLFNAAIAVRKRFTAINPCIIGFVTHFVAKYEENTVRKLEADVLSGFYENNQALDFFVTTSSIPRMTDLIATNPKFTVLDAMDFEDDA